MQVRVVVLARLVESLVAVAGVEGQRHVEDLLRRPEDRVVESLEGQEGTGGDHEHPLVLHTVERPVLLRRRAEVLALQDVNRMAPRSLDGSMVSTTVSSRPLERTR